MVFYDLGDISYAGCHNPFVGLVTCGNSSLVKMTMVNGKIVYKDGKLLAMDIDDIKEKANEISKKIVEKERSNKKVTLE